MKAHHFFAVGLSKRAHLEYDADHDGFERRHGICGASSEAPNLVIIVHDEVVVHGYRLRL